jgi:hypothetical protein
MESGERKCGEYWCSVRRVKVREEERNKKKRTRLIKDR